MEDNTIYDLKIKFNEAVYTLTMKIIHKKEHTIGLLKDELECCNTDNIEFQLKNEQLYIHPFGYFGEILSTTKVES